MSSTTTTSSWRPSNRQEYIDFATRVQGRPPSTAQVEQWATAMGITGADLTDTYSGDNVTAISGNSDAMGMISAAISHYAPGGGFEMSREAQLAKKRATLIPQMQSELVGRGLSGTTIGAAIPARFEQEIATPWQTETDLLRSQNLMQAILAKAGIQERASAQQQERDLAEAQMALQERLADREITAQEYQTALASIAASQHQGGGGGGGGSTGFMQGYGRSSGGEGTPSEATDEGGETPSINYGGGSGGDSGYFEPPGGVTIGGNLYPAGYNPDAYVLGMTQQQRLEKWISDHSYNRR